MSRLSMLLEKLRDREPVLATTVANIAWSGLAQKLGAQPLDFLMLDLEHGTLNLERAEELLRTARLVDLPTVIRVPDAVPHLLSHALDLGADGVLVPRVESVEQVALCVRSFRFAPEGRKGCGGFSLFRPGETVEEVNRNRMLFLQIESDEGIEALEEILTRFAPTLAGILVGPYDLSIMSGVPMEMRHPQLLARIHHIFEVCAQHRMSCGIFVDRAEDLALWRDLGANVFWTGTELSLYLESVTRLCEQFAVLGKGE